MTEKISEELQREADRHWKLSMRWSVFGLSIMVFALLLDLFLLLARDDGTQLMWIVFHCAMASIFLWLLDARARHRREMSDLYERLERARRGRLEGRVYQVEVIVREVQ